MSGPRPVPVTVPDLIKMKQRGEKIVMLTAYDTPVARWVDAAGADILLVGDSLGMVALGYQSTLPVTMAEMVHHTKAVVRGSVRALVVADMPYLSYHLGRRESVRNAGRFVQEAGARAVKIEGGRKRARTIRAIRDAEIPVMGHVGLTPQSVNDLGGFKVQGRSAAAARAVLDDARAVEEAGAFSIVLESIPSELAAMITERLSIPTLGIGAGAGCDGQVLVTHDLIGYTAGQVPSFVRRYAEVGQTIREACAGFVGDVREGRFPNEAESRRLSPEVLAEIRKVPAGRVGHPWKS